MTINLSIAKGITFLSNQQFANGGFRSYMSNNDDMLAYEGSSAGWFTEDGVVFPTLLIGNSLLFLAADPQVDKILNKIADFILSQKNRGSVWNHFTPLHFLYSLCPFDLDDTACASSFLKARNIDFSSNRALLLKNIDSRNLFYTWISFRRRLNFNKTYWITSLRELKNPLKSLFFWKKMACDRDDVDLVVNANVLYYLSDAPNAKYVINYILETVQNNLEIESDKWYKNISTIYYFISRNYYAGVKELLPIKQTMIDRILKTAKSNGAIGESVLDTALAICTLLNLNCYDSSIKLAVEFLISEQIENGSWVKRGFYYDGPKKLVSWGSEELTTSLCLEALGRYGMLTE
ncbi:hypothetical protein [Mucilaginibacter sp. UYCu711]|uniref:hypothetical protein n=1 Tax=Mucilaginibacter sp. UYCu711 TaxID=3156339 RepID=UPI003D1A3CE2